MNDVVLGKVGLLLLLGVVADVLLVTLDGVVVAQDQVLVFVLTFGLARSDRSLLLLVGCHLRFLN